MKRRWIYILVVALALASAPAVANALSATSLRSVIKPRAPLSALSAAHGPLTPLGGSPSYPITNPRTHALYVALQCTDATAATCTHPEHVLAVINTDKCKPDARCKIIARAQAGKSPIAEAIDVRTDTIYVGDGAGMVTVVNGARCNASVTSGCGKPLATIKTGGFVVAVAFNPATRTVYAANLNGDVFVIDAAKCSAVTTKGCGRPVKKVKDPLGPDGIALNIATNTIYAANSAADGSGHTVSVIDGATCNGHVSSGCGQTPKTVNVGANPFWDVVDQATNTVYVANHDDGTVSVINGARCNASVTTGCHGAHPAVPTGADVAFLVVDDTRHTVFVINDGDNTLSEINTRTCGGGVTSGCERRARNEATGFNPPVGGNPSAFALVPKTGVAYLVNPGSAGFLGTVSIKRCNAQDTSDCRVEAPTARNQEFLTSVDPRTHTIYAGNQNHPRIDVLNAATCNAKQLSGCKPVGKIPMPNKQANVGAIDDKTHTLYAADSYGNTISVINIAHCKASDTAGCSSVAPKITVGPGPSQPVLNRKTHTLYAPDGPKSNEVAVLNTSTCNATDTSGCGQSPEQVPVANGSYNLALSATTDTVYAAGSGFCLGCRLGHAVAVINSATCNATHHSGCGHPVADVKVGIAPFGLAVNDHTHTLYVSNNQNGDLPGRVSLIDTSTCNGSHTAGCAGHKPTAPVGRSPGNVAIDAANNTIYVANFASASVSVLDGSKCRADRTNGCARAAHDQPVGSVPQGIAVDPGAHSVYAANDFSPPSLSIFKTSP